MSIYWVLPFLGALIGWGTNMLAIKSLFRPYRALNIGNFKIQGLLPRYQNEIAIKIGKALEKEILTREAMTQHWENLDLEEEAEKALKRFLQGKINRWFLFVPANLQTGILNGMQKVLEKDIKNELEEIRSGLTHRLIEDSNLAELVGEKIKNLPLREVESLVFGIASRELRFIELFGGVLGFFVGLVQIFFIFLAGGI